MFPIALLDAVGWVTFTEADLKQLHARHLRTWNRAPTAEELRQAIVALEPGQWAGPVESGYGLHLVKVLRRVDSAIPDWRDVRRKLVTDVQLEARKAAEDQLYAEIAPRYQIIYGDAVTRVLE